MPVREPHSLGQLSTGLNLRILTMAIHEDYGTASLALAMTVAKYFDLDALPAFDGLELAYPDHGDS